ncbi:MAG: hypothetical protein DDT38_01630 [Firmicutes bacterium]|nr:hypothetical protein [candidate division NPL-UPA2 bacterium]
MSFKPRSELEVALFTRRLTQRQVARLSGVTPSFISHVASGRKKITPRVVAVLTELGIMPPSLPPK